ncbi:MAG: PEGA domain-containing protein [Deltaproteobacteria bacterium]|jgi:TolB-like protein|nr:PEGA domain-containing protein [Deltaproteobacteria bacterium]
MIRQLSIVLFAGLVLTAAAPASAKKSVAVLGLEVVGGTMDMGTIRLAKSLTDNIRRQAARSDSPYRLAPNANKGLAEMKLLSGCDNEGGRCMAAIGQAVSADYLLYGKLKRTKTGAKVSLQLLDVKAARKIKAVTDTIPQGEWDDLDGWSRSLYGRAVGMKMTGLLTISSNATTGTVLVDGDMNTSIAGGLATITGLSEGRHRVSVESPGYKRWNGEVNIVGGQSQRITVELEAVSSTAGPIDGEPSDGSGARTAFWVSLGIGAAAGAFQVVNWFVLRESAIEDKEDAFNRIAADDGQQEIYQAITDNQTGRLDDACTPAKNYTGTPTADLRDLRDACDAGDRTALLSYTAGGVAIVAGAAAAFFFYKGYISADSNTEAEKSTVRVTPALSPNSAGVGLSIDF